MTDLWNILVQLIDLFYVVILCCLRLIRILMLVCLVPLAVVGRLDIDCSCFLYYREEVFVDLIVIIKIFRTVPTRLSKRLV